jgi:DNA-binding NtrC family response regulator
MHDTVVLLVDDEADFVEIMTKRLKKRSFQVEVAYSGPEALEILEKTEKVDIVLLDVKMPGMDGIEALSKIKEHSPLVEVIMLTGHATVDSAVEGLKLGAFDYLMKPCDIKVLMQKLNAAMERRQEQIDQAIEARTQDIILRHGR